MARFGVFKKCSDGEWLFVSWGDSLKHSQEQIAHLIKSDGHFSYFIQDFRRNVKVWSWSPGDDVIS